MNYKKLLSLFLSMNMFNDSLQNDSTASPMSNKRK